MKGDYYAFLSLNHICVVDVIQYNKKTGYITYIAFKAKWTNKNSPAYLAITMPRKGVSFQWSITFLAGELLRLLTKELAGLTLNH